MAIRELETHMNSIFRTTSATRPRTSRSVEGVKVAISPGPLLLDQRVGVEAGVMSASSGEDSAVIPLNQLVSAERHGDLVLLD
jgi:hypothetical protein